MKVKAFVTITVRDVKTGRVLERRRFPSRSYVIAFLDMLYVQAQQAAATIKDTAGTNQSVGAGSTNFAFNGGAGVTAFGIVIGTDDTAVVITDNALGSLIAHGTGSGQMQYGAVGFTAPTTVGSQRRFISTRVTTNNSGAAITVKECGIYIRAGSWNFCGVRDVIAGGVVVGNGQSVTVQYTLSVTA